MISYRLIDSYEFYLWINTIEPRSWLGPFVFSLFALTPHTKFTPLLTLRSLIFGLTPFGWLHTWTLPGECKSNGVEQNREAAFSLQTTSVTVRSLFLFRPRSLFSSIQVFFVVLSTNATMTHPIEEQKLTQR